MSSIDDVKARIDAVDIISETVKLRRSGKNYTGFCPFHANKRTPAFAVFPESGTWKCFSCNEGGDIFAFLMKKEGWDFPETLQYLAQRAGVELKPFTPQQKEEIEEHDRLRELLEDAVHYYRFALKQPGGAAALAYLQKRGVTEKTFETFGLGYSPESWEGTSEYFLKKGYSKEELVNSGMVGERDDGRLYDRFRNRIMFPIRDNRGRMTGFGGRTMSAEDPAKYLNSPQTVLFDKGRLLYGLDLARKSIRSKDQVVIVEGYMDVIIPYQAGFTNLVSPMGTALGEDHFRQLKRYTRRMVLAMDADAAGEKATMRGLEMARKSLDRSVDPLADGRGMFDARGLLRHEGRLKADLRVTTMPAEMDPDEIVLRDPDEWQGIVDAAKPIVLHVMDTLIRNQDVEDPKVKSSIAEKVLPLIEDVPNQIERVDYQQRLARALRLDERAFLTSSAPKSGRRKSGRKAKIEPLESVSIVIGKQHLGIELEKVCLSILIRDPELFHIADRVLQNANLGRLASQDFENQDNQILFRILKKSLEQADLEPTQYIIENIPEDLQNFVATLSQNTEKKKIGVERLLDELVRTMIRLRIVRVNAGLEQLRNFQEGLGDMGDSGPVSYQEIVIQYTQALFHLNQAKNKPIKLD
ncbi:MAG: DNA primase [Anaerolineaceae bacterium]|nr:DNA primase [Anaerolineaceae bacterium]